MCLHIKGPLPITGGPLLNTGGPLPNTGGPLPNTGGPLPNPCGSLPSIGGLIPKQANIYCNFHIRRFFVSVSVKFFFIKSALLKKSII